MLITIGERTRENMTSLGIEEYPFTESELKQKFRDLIKTFHEDVSKNTDSKEKSQKIISAYNELKNLAISEEKVGDDFSIVDERPEDMFDFTKPCSSCNGKGYNNKNIHTQCSSCDVIKVQSWYWKRGRTGFKTLKCYPCNGTGKFTLKSGREVECLKCRGLGKFIVKCKFCNGTGEINEEQKIKCGTCNGTGRVEHKVFNPVIPKGAILNSH